MNMKAHLLSRHLNLDLHRPVLDERAGVASFYCWNLSGQLVGYQQYNPTGYKKVFNSKDKGRYYTYRKLPTVCMWGVESLYQSDGVVFLTEGVFDAARMTNLGQSALASLCNSPPADYKNWLEALGRKVVGVVDNDKAGLKLGEFADYVEVVPKEFGDLGNANQDYVSYLLQKYHGTL